MTADTLRRAATVLRQAAEQATEGRWKAKTHCLRQNCRAVKAGEEFVAMYANRDADYIALVDPAVGLALADWLEHTAKRGLNLGHALLVAQAILREGGGR